MTGGAFFAPAAEEYDLDDLGHEPHAVQWVGAPGIKGAKWAKIPLLTIGMLGIQCVWSIEMGYASPYLLELGLSKSLMSLVFVAGPLSGLIVQPLIGAYADRSRSSFGRRRPFMLGASVICVAAMMLLGWTREIAAAVGLGNAAAILLAVAAIYFIDFSVNALMSADRALVVDTLPSQQQEEGSAWAGRMFGFGSVAGFFVGNLDLTPILPILGHTQLQILSFITSTLLASAHAVTSWAVTERSTAGLFSSIRAIWENMFTLPLGIRSVCIVQFFANLGWYPILFFTSIWASEIYKASTPQGALDDATYEAAAVRSGARALFLQSLVNIATSLGAPLLVECSGVMPRQRAGAHAYEGLGAATGGSFGRDEPGSATWKRLAATEGRVARAKAWAAAVVGAVRDGSAWVLPVPGLTLVRLWCFSQFVFAAAMGASWFVSSPAGVYTIIAVTGFSWGLAQWAPYALLGELVLLDPAAADARLLAQHDGFAEHQLGDDDDDDVARPHTPLSPLAASMPHSSPSHGRPPHVSRVSLSSRAPSARATPEPLESADRLVLRHSDELSASSSSDSDEHDEPRHGGHRSYHSGSSAGRVPSRHGTPSPAAPYAPGGPNGAPGAEPARKSTADKAGLMLGIHNVFIVMPQFIITVFSALIFYLLEPSKHVPATHPQAGLPLVNGTVADPTAVVDDAVATAVAGAARLAGRAEGLVSGGSPDAVGLIFRIGGVAAAVGGYITYRTAQRWAAGRGV